MRIVLEGPFTKQELAQLVGFLQGLDHEQPGRVFSLLIGEHGWPVVEFMEFCSKMGLDYAAVVPTNQKSELHFEGGGGVRLIPFDGERPYYRCRFCPEEFTSPAVRYNHERTHHREQFDALRPRQEKRVRRE